MTTMEMSYSNSYSNNHGGPNRFILFLLLITFIVVGALSHAVAKHSGDSVLAQNCFDNNGVMITIVKPDNNDRRLQLCLDDNGLAIRVSEKINGVFHELTKYLDKNIKTINGMIDYAETEAGSWGWIDYIKVILLQ